MQIENKIIYSKITKESIVSIHVENSPCKSVALLLVSHKIRGNTEREVRSGFKQRKHA